MRRRAFLVACLISGAAAAGPLEFGAGLGTGWGPPRVERPLVLFLRTGVRPRPWIALAGVLTSQKSVDLTGEGTEFRAWSALFEVRVVPLASFPLSPVASVAAGFGRVSDPAPQVVGGDGPRRTEPVLQYALGISAAVDPKVSFSLEYNVTFYTHWPHAREVMDPVGSVEALVLAVSVHP
jgi:hypothetical protein